jgi:predicted transcriptional regulator
MKTASLPSVRIEPELRQKAEDFLREGETLSAFVEQAVRDTIRSREIHQQFLDRGIAARDEARAAGDYYTADDVMAELADMLAEARTQADS